MSVVQIAGRFYSWKSGAWKEQQRSGCPLRVFRFRGDAWQCLKDTRVCRIPNSTAASGFGTLVSVPSTGYDAAEDFGNPFVARSASTRLSTWAEWFDLTLAAAAHAYLDEAMRMSRKRYMASALRLGVAVRAMCDMQMAHDLVDFESVAYESEEMNTLHPTLEYLRRVRKDLEARLRGEAGTVVLP